MGSTILVLFAFFWSSFAEDLELVDAPAAATDGDYYNCSTITPSGSNPSAEVVAAAKQKCMDTTWCLWNPAAKQCWYDKCLKYLENNDLTCDSPAGFSCIPKYITDSYDCVTGAAVQNDRFCRSSPSSTAFLGGIGTVDACFFQDLKSIGTTETAGTPGSGTRSCGGSTCKNVAGGSNVGSYCVAGGADCTLFDPDSDEYCQCLGTDHCDLYPRCLNNGSTGGCILDPCANPEIQPETQSKDSACRINDGGVWSNVATCKGRIENYYNPAADPPALAKRVVCVSTSKANPNECFFAVKSTTTTVNVPGHLDFRGCDTVTYDETVCNSAFILESNGDVSTEKKCDLVDIASGYVSGSKYCTDGDRVVPSPGAGSMVRVSSFLTVLLFVLVALL